MRKKTMFLMLAGILILAFGGARENVAQQRKSVSAAEVNGTYRYYFEGKSKGAYDEIKILSTGKGKLNVSFELTYPYIDGLGNKSANLGSAFGEARIAADAAIFMMTDYPQCRITIKFVKPGQIKVTQNGADTECGFGANVSASGTYKKISGAKPKIDAVN